MRIYLDTTLDNFAPWNGAVSVFERIKDENKIDILEQILEELYPYGIDETTINDLLWFESDEVYRWCGMKTDDEIMDEIEHLKTQIQDLMCDFNNQIHDLMLTSNEEKTKIYEAEYKDKIEYLEEEIEELKEKL